MQQVILVVHSLLALALVGVVLVQRSEGGALGFGGSSSGGGGLMSVRGQANLMTRVTAILAAAFMLTSLGLAVLAGSHGTPRSILDAAPAPVSAPTVPTGPSVPMSVPGAASEAAPATAPAAPATQPTPSAETPSKP